MFQSDTTPPRLANNFLNAIIEVAVVDYYMGDQRQQVDAINYFKSEQYQKHLTILGLPDHYLPDGIHRETIGLFSDHNQLDYFSVKAKA
jgi:hypothetical protein